MFTDQELFHRDPRDFALQMVEGGLVDAQSLLECALKYMSHDDVRGMLDANELSPRFSEDYDDGQPSEQEEWASFDPDC